VLLGVAETKALLTRGHRDIPVTTPAIGALAAFGALGTAKVSVLTPYADPINTAIAAFLESHGHDVARFGSFHLDSDADMSGVTETDIARAAAAIDAPEAEALFISCTALRATGTIAALEAELGKPVVTSNQAMIWHALRLAGVSDARPGPGRLFTRDLDGDVAV
jgi:maleate isomerase